MGVEDGLQGEGGLIDGCRSVVNVFVLWGYGVILWRNRDHLFDCLYL